MNADALSLSKLGLLAGDGVLPLSVIESCRRRGQEVFVLAFEDNTPPATVEGVPHTWVNLGEVGKAVALLREQECERLTIIGRIQRPKLHKLKLDALGSKLLLRLGGGMFKGDNDLLSTIVQFLEEQGFRVAGVDEVVGEALCPPGVLTQTLPTQEMLPGIALGAAEAKALGAKDIGQAVLVKEGRVIACEDARGTDAMITRHAQEGQGAVLVKMCKPQQDRRVDLPAIGPETIEALHRGGFAGAAVEAGASLLVERGRAVTLADGYGMFIAGVTAEGILPV